ncbi:MAG: HlyC/CorC family transporter [Deltaproteobacteria bacterium]|nr:MAG: HlyC/CorC family transporter [Deltaproteobacteria bacterium]
MSPLILIFGEAVPKTVFQQYANRLVPIVSPVVYIFSYVVSPIVWPLSKLTMLLMGGVKGSLLTGHKVTRESLEVILRDADIHRDLPMLFKDRLLKILKFTQKKTRAIMTPLIEVFSLRESTSVGEAALQCREEGYSIFPVFFRRAYNLVGLVSFYDLLLCEDKTKPLSAIMTDPLYVPESMGLKDLFFLFKEKKQKFAVVVDEYGVAVGVVTLEDVQEEIVGEIQDEFDDENKPWQRESLNRFVVEGRAEIDRLNERFRWELPKKNYETLAGFLTDYLGKIPQNGDVISYGGLKFTVRRSTPKTVEEVTVDYE